MIKKIDPADGALDLILESQVLHARANPNLVKDAELGANTGGGAVRINRSPGTTLAPFERPDAGKESRKQHQVAARSITKTKSLDIKDELIRRIIFVSETVGEVRIDRGQVEMLNAAVEEGIQNIMRDAARKRNIEGSILDPRQIGLNQKLQQHIRHLEDEIERIKRDRAMVVSEGVPPPAELDRETSQMEDLVEKLKTMETLMSENETLRQSLGNFNVK